MADTCSQTNLRYVSISERIIIDSYLIGVKSHNEYNCLDMQVTDSVKTSNLDN